MSAAARTTTVLAVSRPEQAPAAGSSSAGRRASAAAAASASRASERSASRASVSRASASRASASAKSRMASLASELSAMRSRSSVQAARASRSRSSESVASVSAARASRSAASVMSISEASVSSKMASIDAVLATATVPTGEASVAAVLSSLTALTATATGTAASAALVSLADAASTLSALAADEAASASSISSQINAVTAPANAVSTTSAMSETSSPGLSGGQIAGVVIGVLAGAVLLLLLGLFCWRRRRKDKGAAGSIFPWRQSDSGRKVSDRYASTWDGTGGEKVSHDEAPHDLWNVNVGHRGRTERMYGTAMGYHPSGREADERWDGDNLTRGAPTRLDNYQEQDAGEGTNFLALDRSEASGDEANEGNRTSNRRRGSPQIRQMNKVPKRPSRQGVSMNPEPSKTQDRASKNTAGRSSRGMSAIGGLMGGLVGSAFYRRQQTPAAPRFPIEDDDDDDDRLFGDGDRHLQSRADGDNSDFYSTLGNRPPRGSSDLRYRQVPVPPPARRPVQTSSRTEKGWGGWSAALAGVARRASGGRYGTARSRDASQTQDWSDEEDSADSVTTIEVCTDSEEDEDDDDDEAEEDESDDELRDLDERNAASKGRQAVYSSCATIGRNGSSRRASYDTAGQWSSRHVSEDEYDEDARSDYTSPTAAVMARMSRDAKGNKVPPSRKARDNPFTRDSAEGDQQAARVPSLPSDFGDGDLDIIDNDEALSSRRRRSSSETKRKERERLAALGTAAAGAGALTGLAAKHRPSNGSTYSRGHYVEPSSSTSGSAKPSRHSTFISSGTDLLGPAAIASRNSSQQRYHGVPARQHSRQASDDIVEEVMDSDNEDNYSDVPLHHRELRNQLSTIFSESDGASVNLREAQSDRRHRPNSGTASEGSVAPLSIKKRSATYGSVPPSLASPASVGSDEVPPAYTSQDGGGRTSFTRRAASMEASRTRTRRSTSPQRQPSQPAEPAGGSSGGLLSGFTAGLRRLTSTLTTASRSPAMGSDQDHFVAERSTRRDSATLPSEENERSAEGVAERASSRREAARHQSIDGSSVPSIGHASFGVGRAKQSASTHNVNGASSEETVSSAAESSSQSLAQSTISRQDGAGVSRSTSAYPFLDVASAMTTRAHRDGPSSGSGEAASDGASLANSSSRRTTGSGRTDAATRGSSERRSVQRSGTVSTNAASEASRYGGEEGDDVEEAEEEADEQEEEEGQEEQDLTWAANPEHIDARPAPPLQAAHYPSSSLGEAVLRQARREAGLGDEKVAAPGEALPTMPTDTTLVNDEKVGLGLPTSPAKWRQSPRVETISKHAVVAALNLQRRAQHTYQPSQDFSLISPSTSRASFEAPPPSYGLPDVRRGAMRNSRTFDGTWPTAPRVSLLQGHNGDDLGNGALSGEKEALQRAMSQQAPPRRQGQGWFAY
ncbi:hypothetical protein BCV69DRAFT_79734 [Microstroma glucosiphilum]|uniref:Uncharacterized protein n=1 Tax=Pseudomicrostroma glucosiphilum TaxID=1684307 RepID=A0A316TYM1_9BASI|nr:hypothetical protein BCV69DRAFT_79734 [Pseudomicrostroma glucosiphilum]PWN18247.1 hypothetical protein BCV69DRAFT_79734 [Pseudomicrostroma glucosiphilum]